MNETRERAEPTEAWGLFAGDGTFLRTPSPRELTWWEQEPEAFRAFAGNYIRRVRIEPMSDNKGEGE